MSRAPSDRLGRTPRRPILPRSRAARRHLSARPAHVRQDIAIGGPDLAGRALRAGLSTSRGSRRRRVRRDDGATVDVIRPAACPPVVLALRQRSSFAPRRPWSARTRCFALSVLWARCETHPPKRTSDGTRRTFGGTSNGARARGHYTTPLPGPTRGSEGRESRTVGCRTPGLADLAGRGFSAPSRPTPTEETPTAERSSAERSARRGPAPRRRPAPRQDRARPGSAVGAGTPVAPR